MNFSERNRKRCESPSGFNHKIESWSLSDWMTATVGELGEAANVIKKLNRVRDGIPGNKETEDELRQMLAEELADGDIYLDLLTQAAGFDLVSERNRRRCEMPTGFYDRPEFWSLSDWLTDSASSLGKAAGIISELNRVRDGIPGNLESAEDLRLMLAAELADAAIYLDQLIQAAGFNREEIRDAKFEKTSKKIGYSE